ncbi:hypothetical protein [Arcicella rosea]|uniref:Uncharacterized protein n=1 Tax=Arcicella rosea TaxID=502909 RepID=A0A841ELY7_9BACT|nr:hypothetical protein [Arcicella rosea]MBB6003174.1 hypothetical protein [Arcicella rosea]
MNLSYDIQQHLENIKSSVSLGRWEGNIMPDYCAFAHSKKRNISAGLCKDGIELSMSEKDFCYARVLTSDIETIAHLIDLWLGKGLFIEELKSRFQEVELFEGFPEDKKGKRLLKKWNEVKNAFFKDQYSSSTFHYDICIKILEDAKKDTTLSKMYPYISLGKLCFSDRANGFSNYLCIAPTHWKSINEKYFVFITSDNKNIQINIDDLNEGLEILKQNIYRLNGRPKT